ncbi:ABC transporter permease [Pseudolactococcus piscium]|uniref:ABC transporter permease n=1 Tax=Pseudolactococcus piscium TaxID=1364 RepID=UPI000BDE60D9|nr:ABC transporter permease [Lactococcus piscium]
MDFIRRAWLYTKAKIGKTILLIVIFSSILIFVLSGLVINNSAKQSIENAKKETGATVTLAVNREAMMNKSRTEASDSSIEKSKTSFDITPVKLSDATAISKLSGIKSYNFTKSAVAVKDSIEPIASTSESAESSSSSEVNRDKEGPGGGVEPIKMNQGDFTVIGINNLKTVSDFSDGTNKITSGRALNAEDEKSNNVVIEADLALANSLKAGSTFTIKDTDGKAYTMTVVGIYKSSSSVDSMAANFSFMNVSNRLYTSLTFANTLAGTSDTIESATYNLTDPAKSASFVKAAKKLIDTEAYTVTSNDSVYQQMLAPLNNVAKFAKNIVILVAIAGTIILTLIVILTIRERRGEIGILMSMGEGRLKIIGQFFIELFLVMIVAIGIASATGNIVGNVVGSQLLSSQTTKTAESTNSSQHQMGGGQVPGNKEGSNTSRRGGNPFGQSQSQIKVIDKLEVKMTSKQLFILAAIALGIIVIAIIIASLGIIRLNPKEILTGA